MDKAFEKMKWGDIYRYWQMSTTDHYRIVNKAPLVHWIKVNNHNQSRLYTHLWLRNDQIDKAQSDMNRLIDTPFHSGWDNAFTDERINRTADLMAFSKSKEERAAIWLYVFCSSFENVQLPNPNSKYLDMVSAKARLFLEDSFQEWFIKRSHRFPHLFVNSEILNKVKFERYSVIIDVAIMNAYMICNEYSIVLFDSEPEKEELPFSYRDLRKE